MHVWDCNQVAAVSFVHKAALEVGLIPLIVLDGGLAKLFGFGDTKIKA